MSRLFKRIKDWSTRITAFRTGDVIPVDGPDGTAKMSKDDLLKESADNTLSSIKSIDSCATEADLKAGNYLALDGAEGTKKLPAEAVAKSSDPRITCHVITDNPEYAYAVVDEQGHFLFGVRQDGSFEWATGLPSVVKEAVNEINLSLVGKVDKEENKSLIGEAVAEALDCIDNPRFAQCVVDENNKVIEAITEGKRKFFVPVNFAGGVEWSNENLSDLGRALKEFGFNGGCGDWSENSKLKIGEPRFAVVNFSNINSMPATKTTDAQAVFEFWDLNGNYFKKNAIVNAQGNSSMTYVKKNFSIDICNDKWIGDDTFKLKIGNWVEQDSFHLKAYYTDFFKGCSVVSYKIADAIQRSRGILGDRPWKKAMIDPSKISSDNYKNPATPGSFATQQFSDMSMQIDNGARCMPDGFPCAVYLNGVFYGLYAFSLKKHRDNYHMNKNEKLQVHLDGELTAASIWGGSINWSMFEVRNPKIKTDKAGNPYDGDHPTEIPDGPTHDAITNLASRMTQINAAATIEEKKALFETYFDLDTLIDYEITQMVCYDRDSVAKNCQWITYDGIKWFACNYDKDLTFGNYVNGQFSYPCPSTMSWIYSNGSPFHFLVINYKSEIKQRWQELVSNGIISKDFVKNLFIEWIDRIGEQYFSLEYKKWDESPCCRDNRLNKDYWDFTNVYYNYAPSSYSSSTTYSQGSVVKYSGLVYKSLQESNVGHEPSTSPSYWSLVEYDPTKSYSVGDTCWFGFEFKVEFICVADCTGQQPLTASYTNTPKELGYYDSYWRLDKFIDGLFVAIENLFNSI